MPTHSLPGSTALPTILEQAVAALPPILDRRTAAKAISQHLFQVSPRTLERWPVPTAVVNGRAHAPARAWFEHAAWVARSATSITN